MGQANWLWGDREPTHAKLVASSFLAGLPQCPSSTHSHIASGLTVGLPSILPAFSRCLTPSPGTPCLSPWVPSNPSTGSPTPSPQPPAGAYLLGTASTPSFIQLVGSTRPLPLNCNSIPVPALQDTPGCPVQHGRAFRVSQSINIDQAVWGASPLPVGW